MKKVIPQGGASPSAGRSLWEDMLYRQVADAVSHHGEGLGMQTKLYQELQKN